MFISERYGVLNLLINASGILSIPDVMQPGTDVSKLQSPRILNVIIHQKNKKFILAYMFAIICLPISRFYLSILNPHT